MSDYVLCIQVQHAFELQVRASDSVLALLATCDRGSLLLTELLGAVAALTVREADLKSLSSHL
jgi:hypothetical protein